MEEQIGELSDDYRDFLTQVGWTSLGAQEIAGLGNDLPHRWQDVAELTQKERLHGGLPRHLIAVHADGGGNFNCLDRQRIVFWSHEDQDATPVAETFVDWLSQVLATP